MRTINEANLSAFMTEYRRTLPAAVAKHQADYYYTPDQCGPVLDKMEAAFRRGDYNHNSLAIAAAMRAVGLKTTTRKALESFFTGVTP